MLSPGAQIGNYIIEQEIGCGGMARLYRVRHAVLQTLHALKVLEPAYREKAELRTRFLNEAMIGAKLHHPNIVRVTDVVSTPEVAGILMDLVAGPNLETYIRSLTAPPTAETIRSLFVPVLEAVAEAHKQGIVHRDLKPANILLEPVGSGYVPKVTDFGIAKVTDAARELVSKKHSTHADARMGTLAYMSPEQIRHAKEVTVRSDIFSLGATLYELATLRVAFAGDSDYEIMHQIVEGRYIPIDKIVGVDAGIAAAITKALQPDPERRFANCERFIHALSGPEAASAPTAEAATPGPAPPAPLPSPPARPSPTPAVPMRPVPLRAKGLPFSKRSALLLAVIAVALVFTWLHDSARKSQPYQSMPTGTGPPLPLVESARHSLRETWTGPTPFDGCLKSRVALRVAVTCLTAERGFTDVAELRSWFAKLPTAMIDVVLLERKNGARLISLEISRDKWLPWWNGIVGAATGEEVCWVLGKALLDNNVGRPLEQRMNERRTAYEYDIFDVRNPTKYPQVQSLGTLEEALSPQGLQVMQQWLFGIP